MTTTFFSGPGWEAGPLRRWHKKKKESPPSLNMAMKTAVLETRCYFIDPTCL